MEQTEVKASDNDEPEDKMSHLLYLNKIPNTAMTTRKACHSLFNDSDRPNRSSLDLKLPFAVVVSKNVKNLKIKKE